MPLTYWLLENSWNFWHFQSILKLLECEFSYEFTYKTAKFQTMHNKKACKKSQENWTKNEILIISKATVECGCDQAMPNWKCGLTMTWLKSNEHIMLQNQTRTILWTQWIQYEWAFLFFFFKKWSLLNKKSIIRKM